VNCRCLIFLPFPENIVRFCDMIHFTNMLTHQMRVKTGCWGEYLVLSRDSNSRMVESFIICALHYLNIISVIISRTWDGQCVWCTWERQAMQHFSPEIWKEEAALWDDNIKMDLKGRGYENVDWVHLPQNMLHGRDFVYIEMNFRFPQKREEFG
jgi:hypothetical protein